MEGNLFGLGIRRISHEVENSLERLVTKKGPEPSLCAGEGLPEGVTLFVV